MSIAVTEVQGEAIELRACPVCGKSPRIIQTILGSCFVQCYPHAETETVQTLDDAVRRWNRGKLLGRHVEGQS